MPKEIQKTKQENIVFSFSSTRNRKIIPVSLIEDKPNRLIEKKDGSLELLVSTGHRSEVTLRKLFLITRQIVVLARQHRFENIAIDFKEFKFSSIDIDDNELAQLLTTNFEMANFEFVQLRTEPEDGWSFVREIHISNSPASVKEFFSKGQIIGSQINACRIMANTPALHMTPSILAQKAKEMAKGTDVRVKVLDVDDMRILKMGGVLGVGQGSSEEPKFIVAEYYGENKKEKPIVLVGKGVTFDSGGLSLKPSDFMADMHHDMAGGAAVLHTVFGASKIGLKKNLVALIPAVENMPSGSSYHPGDVLRTMSGKTIEILNTDAEGRVILADALTYAGKYAPKLVIDVATLTGAAIGALGQRAAAIFTKDEKLSKKVQEIGEAVGDYMWPLPLWDEYEEEIKGNFGDWTNIGKTKYGGAITAAIFLYQFAKGDPWLHVDIAPTMSTIDGQYLSKGASGSPIRMLLRLLEDI